MILDLTRLGASETEDLNSVADEIRPVYIEAVSNSSKGRVHLYSWYLYPFASRNTYSCDVFDAVVRYFYIKKRLKEDANISTVIVFEEHESQPLRNLFKDRSGLSIVKIKPPLSRSIMRFFQAASFAAWGLVQTLSYLLACLVTRDKKKYRNVSNRLLVGETIYYENSLAADGELIDRHFGHVFEEIEDYTNQKVVVFPLFYGLFNYYALYRALLSSNREYLFLPQLVNIMDYFKIIYSVTFSKKEEVSLLVKRIDFSDLPYKSIKKNKWKFSSMLASLKYLSIQRLAIQAGQIDINVLRWHEGHEVDRMSLLSWRECFKKINIVGYYDAFVPRNYLCPILSESDILHDQIPDVMFCISASVARDMEACVKPSRIKITSSLRFDSKFETSNSIESKTLRSSILIAFPVDERIAMDILNVVSSVIQDEQLECQFIFRPHPATNLNFNKELEYSNVSLDLNTPFNVLLSRVGVVIGSASSTLVQGLMAGKKVVVIGVLGRLSASPIPSSVDKSLYTEVFDSQQLTGYLKKLATVKNDVILDDPILVKDGCLISDICSSFNRESCK